EPGAELDALDRADALGRQLAGAIENMQLLDDVIRSRRELENTLDSIGDLVAVSDGAGAIVRVNPAFAARPGGTREELVGRPVSDCVGPQAAAWLRGMQAAPNDGTTAITVADAVLKGSFLLTVSPLVDYDGACAGTVIVAREVTPQRPAEA